MHVQEPSSISKSWYRYEIHHWVILFLNIFQYAFDWNIKKKVICITQCMNQYKWINSDDTTARKSSKDCWENSRMNLWKRHKIFSDDLSSSFFSQNIGSQFENKQNLYYLCPHEMVVMLKMVFYQVNFSLNLKKCIKTLHSISKFNLTKLHCIQKKKSIFFEMVVSENLFFGHNCFKSTFF